MARPKSFKTLEQEAVAVLGRHGFKFDQKLKSEEIVNTRIYTKGLSNGCVLSVHMGETSSLTLMFHENFVQILYSAIFILTFNNYNVEVISVDVTSNARYSCILKELKRELKGI
ncbi:hypothetical protein [Ruminococcus sp.]|uniref:hypothetical protein n=1 Tax=Ruminococcus sp. TaxID=41978 RepID=UPI001B6D67DA|nr:hypothetical protein [Ruminococcus sp.]MBP5433727.1 hypothetical protein [Ruminococcus sp.]